MSWLDDLLGTQWSLAGVLVPRRAVTNIPNGAQFTDNPGANRTDLTLLAGQGQGYQASTIPVFWTNY